MITSQTFLLIGLPGSRFRSREERLIRFKSMYGISPEVASDLWYMCDFRRGTKPKHLLWGLLQLNVYASEHVLTTITGVDRKTFRKWSWACIESIWNSLPDVVKLADRFKAGPYGSKRRTCLMTVDGTDFPIAEPQPFDKKWFCQKTRHAGVRYEVAVCIQTGEIVHVNGPFACGRWPDLKIYRSFLKQMLQPGEMVEADDGYPDLTVRMASHHVSHQDTRARSRARARHEATNKLFKQWGCLRQSFRHPLYKHKYCFGAVVVCTQLSMRREGVPFHVVY
ncbi:expressed unknown protein [Seminavis robusta]|uniref:DDE Tnp4 domain-containing protein n=1 Tax=Seminavis robusta TaxID=568900 RepID=A0A9N8EUA3_9STRA|nr:expressed unknown protein [Seminavis robusta]|eukprot:Sro1970_g308540.1 n/a (280) ;mRNA; f:13508-14418